MYPVESLYGNYRNRTFAEIYPDAETFIDNYLLVMPDEYTSYTVNSTDAEFIFYLLYARYGNNVIASSDENRFKFQVSSLIFQYGPLWKKELDIQKDLRQLTTAQIQQGSFSINNHSYNPSTEPSTGSLTELTKIDEQATNRWMKSPLEGYASLMMLLNKDSTNAFLDKFKKLFLTVVEPEIPLWYVTDEEDD